MVKRGRSEFQVKRGGTWGDRLIWRNPGAHEEVRRQMLQDGAPEGVTDLPKSVSVGHYRWLDEPGCWVFQPNPTPVAIAALGVEMVQVRICDDLAMRTAKTVADISRDS